MSRIKTFFLVFVLSAFCSYGQERRLPLENSFLRNGMDANGKSVTNLLFVSFIDSGSNVVIDASTFLRLFDGESRKLLNADDEQQFVVISNGRPWMITAEGVREVTLNGDTSFIRQHEPTANLSNVLVHSSLVILNEGGVDDSDYGVNYSDLTNGNVAAIDVIRHFKAGREVYPVQDTFVLTTQAVESVSYGIDVAGSLLSSVSLDFYAASSSGFSAGNLSFYMTTSPAPRVVGVPVLSVSAYEGSAPSLSFSFDGAPVVLLESNCLWRIRGRTTDMGM